MGTLRDRCQEMLDRMQMNGIMRQGDSVEDLMAFVVSERGRSADASLEDTRALVLYFGSDADRDEFKAAVLAAKPGMVAKKIP